MAMDPKLKEEFKKQSLPLVDVSEWYGQRYLAALREPEPGLVFCCSDGCFGFSLIV